MRCPVGKLCYTGTVLFVCFKLLTVMLFLIVKQDLVYNATTGALVGFTDLSHRHNPKAETLATHALTVYAKSYSGRPGLKHPLAYFASTAMTGPQLASIMWECVALLEHHGLQV